MARTKKVAEEPKEADTITLRVPKLKYTHFSIWIVGDTPLITHAWSKKAKDEMFNKQVNLVNTKRGKEPKNPDQEFVDSLYDLGDGTYGFPAMGVKNCILSAAHKDKGIARDMTMRALWINAQMHRVRPAKKEAICDMPLLRIYGDEPVMREDMVKIGSGLNKVAAFAYRGQFSTWGMRITGRFNAHQLNMEAIAFLISECGVAAGLGEWRNERRGMFGAFHLADDIETKAWEKFAAKKGPMPQSVAYAMAA